MKQLRMTITVTLLSAFLVFTEIGYADGGGSGSPPGDVLVNASNNVVSTEQTQVQQVYGPGYAVSDVDVGDISVEGGQGGQGGQGGDAGAVALSSINTTSISKSKVRIPPLSIIPPYLPYWTHGGWGLLKAYFPNGPSSDDTVYERTFDPSDPEDMDELRGVLTSLPHTGPLKLVGGMLNGVSAVFGGPDQFHHGRGFEIANALIRERRPEGKPLLVFIDSNVDRGLLKKAGYAYVGRVSLEGDVDRNWDHVYDAAVAEALPWNVDILLITGGMKGVTVGSNVSFPGAAGAYSQTNYSLSLFGAMSNGITEGKGKAQVSAEGYRFWPQALIKRRIPKALYDRIQARPTSAGGVSQQQSSAAGQKVGVRVSKELYDLAGFEEGQNVQNLVIY